MSAAESIVKEARIRTRKLLVNTILYGTAPRGMDCNSHEWDDHYDDVNSWDAEVLKCDRDDVSKMLFATSSFSDASLDELIAKITLEHLYHESHFVDEMADYAHNNREQYYDAIALMVDQIRNLRDNGFID